MLWAPCNSLRAWFIDLKVTCNEEEDDDIDWEEGSDGEQGVDDGGRGEEEEDEGEVEGEEEDGYGMEEDLKGLEDLEIDLKEDSAAGESGCVCPVVCVVLDAACIGTVETEGMGVRVLERTDMCRCRRTYGHVEEADTLGTCSYAPMELGSPLVIADVAASLCVVEKLTSCGRPHQ